jgi:D-cysteine desulfhydrase
VIAPHRISIANLPTPLERADRLTAAWGGPTIWIKRDDLTGFGTSGNKVRKLEYHLAAALDAGATTVITTGAAQSNHCRATAIACARLGLRCVLYLRTPDGNPPPHVEGNHLLQRLAGAETRFITPAEYAGRDALMEQAGAEIGDAWVIPEGASDVLGMWGFVAAMEEVKAQIEGAGVEMTAIWHAAMSAGTTAGMAWGAGIYDVDADVVGCAVGDSAAEIDHRVRLILTEAVAAGIGPPPRERFRIVDDYIGAGYGIASAEELAVQVEVTRLTGLIFDPSYTGKAIYGLAREIEAGRYRSGDNVVYWHTGGGFAAFAHDWSGVLSS